MSHIRIHIFFLSLFILLAILSGAQPAAAAFSPEARLFSFVAGEDDSVLSDYIIYEAFRRMGMAISVQSMGRVFALEGVNVGLYDGLISQADDFGDAYNNLIRIPVEVLPSEIRIISMAGDTQKYASWEDLRGKIVGTLPQKPHTTRRLSSVARAHITQPSWTALLQALRNGECDVLAVATTPS